MTHKIEVLGVLTTKYNPRRKKSQRHDTILKEVVEDGMKSYLFDIRIRDTEKASTYVEACVDVIRHDPCCHTSLDYYAFVEEMKLRLASFSNY